MVYCIEHIGLGAGLWFPSTHASAFSPNLMGQSMEPHCLTKNCFMSLLLGVLADTICCLYYLVKMLISQPQWGIVSVIDSASLLDMWKSLQNLCAILPRSLYSFSVLEQVMRIKLYKQHLVILLPQASTMSHEVKDGRTARCFKTLCMSSAERSGICKNLRELLPLSRTLHKIPRPDPNCPWKTQK